MTPARQLAACLRKFTPEVAAVARAVLRRMAARLPGATRLVYDNYNALVIGFGPSARASDAVFSIAVYPRWVSLFFLHGAELPDPDRRLQGRGSRVRHIVLHSAEDLDAPAVRALMADALRQSTPRVPASGRGPLLIKAIAARQRPRRPVAASRRRR